MGSSSKSTLARCGTVQTALVGIRRRGLDVGLMILLSVLAAIHAWMYRLVSIDDAYITYRYAENLADGLGFVFNPNEYTEGTSTVLFTFLLAGAHKLGLDIEWASKVIGISAFAIIVVLVYRFVIGSVCSGYARVHAVLASALTLSFTPLAYHAAVGMELTVYVALLLAGTFGFVRSHLGQPRAGCWPLWMALAATTRLEAAGLAILLLIVSLGLSVRRARSAFRESRLLLARLHGRQWLLLAVVLVPLEVLRYLYFGTLLPNSIIAKSGYGSTLLELPLLDAWAVFRQDSGLQMIATFSREHLAYLPVVLPLGWLSARYRLHTTVLVLVMGYVAAVVLWNNGDWMPHSRLLAPALPVAAVGLVFGAESVGERLPGRLAALVLGIPVTAYAIDSGFYQRQLPAPASPVAQNMRRIGEALREVARPSDLLATDMAGRVPYYSRMRTLDVFGLCDSHIARHGTRVPHMGRVDWPYVFAQRPSYYFYNFASGVKAMLAHEAFRPYRHDYLVVVTPFDRFRRYRDRKVLLSRRDNPRLPELVAHLNARLTDPELLR